MLDDCSAEICLTGVGEGDRSCREISIFAPDTAYMPQRGSPEAALLPAPEVTVEDVSVGGAVW